MLAATTLLVAIGLLGFIRHTSSGIIRRRSGLFRNPRRLFGCFDRLGSKDFQSEGVGHESQHLETDAHNRLVRGELDGVGGELGGKIVQNKGDTVEQS